MGFWDPQTYLWKKRINIYSIEKYSQTQVKLTDASHDSSHSRKVYSEYGEPIVALGESWASVVGHEFHTPTIETTL